MKLTTLILLLSVQLHAGSHERAQQFFIKHYEAAEQLYFCDSIPIELSLSCWALESGYGSSNAAIKCNNLGGIKSYEGGKKHNKHFATLSDFYTAYSAIFRQPCYSNDMKPKTVDEYLRAMEYACCSYHHSKGYSRKIKWIIKNFKIEEMEHNYKLLDSVVREIHKEIKYDEKTVKKRNNEDYIKGFSEAVRTLTIIIRQQTSIDVLSDANKKPNLKKFEEKIAEHLK